jgi:hypothetical protein
MTHTYLKGGSRHHRWWHCAVAGILRIHTEIICISILKKNRAGGLAQEVKHLPSKSEVLSSTFSTTKEKRKHSCLTFLKHVLKYDFL